MQGLGTPNLAVVVATLIAALVLGALAVWRSSGAVKDPQRSERALFGSDIDDLAQAFEAVEAESVDTLRALVRIRLAELRRHRTPLRQIRASPGPGVGRFGFADGTVLVARTLNPLDRSRLIRLHQHGGLVVGTDEDHPDGVIIRLAHDGAGPSVALVVLGLDQCD
ncbi:MAG: hypothetical protein Q4G67_02650 [Actinomycetia bacterium]|nr:hypothetical protein [Actinomycetes bacterium]